MIKVTEDDLNIKFWKDKIAVYEYYYFNVKVASVSYNSSSVHVGVHEAFAPWAYVHNNSGRYLCKISRVEDQIHGVNIIEMDNLEALFVEQEVNESKKADASWLVSKDSENFSALLKQNIDYATKQMLAELLNQDKTRLQGPTTFPMWNSKGK